jgi:hypothetical protein
MGGGAGVWVSGSPAPIQASVPPSSSRTSRTPAYSSRCATRALATNWRPASTTVLSCRMPSACSSASRRVSLTLFHSGACSMRCTSSQRAPGICPPDGGTGPSTTSNSCQPAAGALAGSCPVSSCCSHDADTSWRARARSGRAVLPVGGSGEGRVDTMVQLQGTDDFRPRSAAGRATDYHGRSARRAFRVGEWRWVHGL